MNEDNTFVGLMKAFGAMAVQLWHDLPYVVIVVGVAIVTAIIFAVYRRATKKRRNRKAIRYKQAPHKTQSAPTNAKPCQHHECGKQLTTHWNKEGHPGCVAGGPCCVDCHLRHVAEVELRQFNNGHQMICPEPACRRKMVAVLKNGYLAHECRNGCQGAFIGGKYLRKAGNG